MTSLHEPLALRRGPALRNRLALAPLTNTQSHADGTLSDDEIGWLTARARGGFGLVVTAAPTCSARGGPGPARSGWRPTTTCPA